MHADTPMAMTRSLAEARYGSEVRTAFLTGIQAVARLPLDQRRLDDRAGLDTAGFVSGYRGSPLGGLDQALWRNSSQLEAHRVVFQPGINEDLAATAVWGTQQVGLFPGARHAGVFGMWYGKAPGLDRSTDAIRHANAAGTSPLGGVVAVVGDDHGCKSSTLPAASEYELRDLGIPVLAPADVQDVLDFGLAGWALSRYAGCWTGLIALTDVMDSALSVEVGLDRHRFVLPPHGDATASRPPRDSAARNLQLRRHVVHIRLGDSPLEQETRLEMKLRLARAFASANPIDRIVASPSRPRLVVVTAGKAYADVREALDKLELRSEEGIADAGIRLVKLGMTWPLDGDRVREFCRGTDRILVVEEKRAFIEEQLKAILFGDPVEVLGKRPRTVDTGATDPGLACGFPQSGELDVPMIASTLATVLKRVTDTGYLGEVAVTAGALPDDAKNAKEARQPLYCAGCPHNTSTRVPEGSRAAAGIGCHYMAQWMDRSTATVTHMGAEGVNWIGQAPFTDEQHIFANLGDGTYFHSGILAIRAAVAAGVNITYKILLNDAVAMTGGQPVEGGLTVEDIVAQVRAEGVTDVRVVSDDPGRHRKSPVRVVSRRKLDAVQRELENVPGCSVLVYEQTCAAELRRRRKRGLALDPDVRVVINDAVCEGCGDCSVQSSCVAVEPLETEFGTKRTINQSACNKDLKCLDGFCPALVTVSGARPKTPIPVRDDIGERLPEPDIGPESANILIAGVGGTGIVTVSQLLGTAAHLDGRYVSTLDMTGLAQKGGAVTSHVRISASDAPHPPTRIPPVSVDMLIAADAVTAASRDVLPLASPQRTTVVLNSHVAPTAEFVLRQRDGVDLARLSDRLRHRARHMATVDADSASRALFGSTTAANVLMLGYAYQTGAIPVSVAALERAISLNGVAVADNLAAFHHGRLAAHVDSNPQTEGDKHIAMPIARSEVMQPQRSETLAERIAVRRTFLVDYQDEALARRYEQLIERVRVAELRVHPTENALVAAVADSYFKLLAVKDEYEVARLFSKRPAGVGLDFATKLGGQFDPGFKTTFHFAPPFLGRRGANGRPCKIAVGGWFAPVLRVLAKLRWLRGTALDPFRHTAERRLERELLATFEADMQTLVDVLDAANYYACVALAKLPAGIKGFGPVKENTARAALAKRERYLADALAEPVSARTQNGHSPRTREDEAA